MSGEPNSTTVHTDEATGEYTVTTWDDKGVNAIETTFSKAHRILGQDYIGPDAEKLRALSDDIARRTSERTHELLYGNRKPGDPEPRGILGSEA